MQKTTLSHIEDYIELLSGYVGLRGRNMSFSLARYDVQIVASLADQTTRGIGYTDRQAILAHKLVVKYKRQFAKYDIDVGFHEENGHFRIPVRVVDRSKSIRITDDLIYLRFPYDSKMIDDIKESGKNVPGSIQFDKEKKAWVFGITEPRLQWVKTLADKYQFEVDDTIKQLINNVELEKTKPYQIQLQRLDGCLCISNAEQSLNDYVVDKLGGFNESNLLRLVDYSGVLGYTVSDDITAELERSKNINQTMLLLKRESHIPLEENGQGLDDIISYAKDTDRWPIYVFENTDVNAGKIISHLKKYFSDSEILEVGPKQRKLDPEGKKCIYLNNWQTSWQFKIPLLITMTSLMIGPKKQHIMQLSDKVVYCTNVVIKYSGSTVA